MTSCRFLMSPIAMQEFEGTLTRSLHWPLLTTTVGREIGLQTITLNGTGEVVLPVIAVPCAAGTQLRGQLRGQLRLRFGRRVLD